MELGLLPTEELVNEILKRFDDAIFVGVQRQSEQSGVTASYFAGDLYACLGLSIIAQNHLSGVLLSHAEQREGLGEAN